METSLPELQSFVIPFLNQSAIFVGCVVGFLNVCTIRLVASSLPPRYHLWFRNGIRLTYHQ